MIRARATVGCLAVAALLLVGVGCSSGGSGSGPAQQSGTPKGQGSASAIPVAGAQPVAVAPEFTSHPPSVPTEGVTLEELHSQGKTEVIR